MLATLLDDSHAALLWRFLLADVESNLFAIGVLRVWGLDGHGVVSWWGHLDDAGGLDAVVLTEGFRPGLGHRLVVPMGDPQAVRMLGPEVAGRDGAEWMVGASHAVDALAPFLSEGAPVLHRDQILMCLEAVVPGPMMPVCLATQADWAWVMEAERAVNLSDLGLDLRDRGEIQFERSVQASIAQKSEWIGGERVYRAKVGTLCEEGAQLGGIWVDPRFRSGGVGQKATRALCERLLGLVPRITLHVSPENGVARRCYEAVGFRDARAFRLWVR